MDLDKDGEAFEEKNTLLTQEWLYYILELCGRWKEKMDLGKCQRIFKANILQSVRYFSMVIA